MRLLTSYDEFADYANLPVEAVSATGSTYSAYIQAAESLLERHCNSILTPSTTPLYVPGNGEEYVILPTHIRELTTLEQVVDSGSDVVLTTNVMLGDPFASTKGYVLDDDATPMYTILHAKPGTDFGFVPGNRYRVSGKFGPSAIPSCVKLATALLVKHLVKLSNTEAVKQMAVEGKAVQYGRTKSIPDSIASLVAEYTIPKNAL